MSTINNQKTIIVPERFTFFNRGIVDFEGVLSVFDWELYDRPVVIDMSMCISANYQALALLVAYIWRLTANKCEVELKYGNVNSGAAQMMFRMGAANWWPVLIDDSRNFRFGEDINRTLYALRRRDEVRIAIDKARAYVTRLKLVFPDYLSHITAELLYNATEHGRKQVEINSQLRWLPSVLSFGYYTLISRFSLLIADNGMGIKEHLELTYPSHPNHQEAILHSLQPKVSGTFGIRGPYQAQDNAGMGLAVSSSIVRKLGADMYVVSYDGLVHISHSDVTARTLRSPWPGTFVLLNITKPRDAGMPLEELLGQLAARAQSELTNAAEDERRNVFYVSVVNLFGKNAVDKEAAIAYRDRHILPAVLSGKTIELDFKDVVVVPHSFLSALIATPIKRLGLAAYKRIKPYNATSAIREIFDVILADNTPN